MISSSFINESQEVAERKMYTGVTLAKVLCVNPDATEYAALFGREPQSELVYTGKDKDDKDYFKVVLYLETLMTEKPIRVRLDYYVSTKMMSSVRTGKMQVIDRFSNTTWVLPQDFQAQSVPVQTNGHLARILPPYRAAVQGEERLMDFIKNLTGVESIFNYDRATGRFTQRTDKPESDFECRFDDLAPFFRGNFKELKDIVRMSKDRMIKILVGIHTGDNGNMYQCVYPKTYKPTSNDFKLIKDYENDLAGGYVKDYYELSPIHEFVGGAAAMAAQTRQRQDTQLVQPAQPVQQPLYQQQTVSNASEDDLPF